MAALAMRLGKIAPQGSDSGSDRLTDKGLSSVGWLRARFAARRAEVDSFSAIDPGQSLQPAGQVTATPHRLASPARFLGADDWSRETRIGRLGNVARFIAEARKT
jgi:hypothetical protein